jgi:hypothetical protein
VIRQMKTLSVFVGVFSFESVGQHSFVELVDTLCSLIQLLSNAGVFIGNAGVGLFMRSNVNFDVGGGFPHP